MKNYKEITRDIREEGSQEEEKNKDKYREIRKFFCGNCGRTNHNYKNCKESIISIGVINVLITTDNKNISKNLIENLSINTDNLNGTESESPTHNCDLRELRETQETRELQELKYRENIVHNSYGIDVTYIKTFCLYKDNIKFLMIRRKHTLGYLELLRGRYLLNNILGIQFLFTQMIKEEIDMISKMSFDELWTATWPSFNSLIKYPKEYTEAKEKFEKLKYGEKDNLNKDNLNKEKLKEVPFNLEYYIKNSKPVYTCAEWGFPKGRRNNNESDLMCAIREFKEETNLKDADYLILDKIAPIKELLLGTDGVNYKHIYYPAISMTNKLPEILLDDKLQSSEIGDIGWFTYEESIKLIRPYHIDRIKIITQLFNYFINKLSKI